MKQIKSFGLKALYTILLSIVCYATSNAQMVDNIKTLRQKILLADSIQLISHRLSKENVTIEDERMSIKQYAKLHPEIQSLIINNKLNRQLVTESTSLSDSNKVKLSNILLRQVLIKKLTYAKCDDPRHTIVMYKKNKQSYVDICFGCRRIHTSKDIDFSEFYMDEKKWEGLKAFFKANGITKVFKENNE